MRQIERIAVRDKPVWVCNIPWQHTGVILRNTGAANVFVVTGGDDRDDFGHTAEQMTAEGLSIAPGQTVTLPTLTDQPLPVYAATAGDPGELTHFSL